MAAAAVAATPPLPPLDGEAAAAAAASDAVTVHVVLPSRSSRAAGRNTASSQGGASQAMFDVPCSVCNKLIRTNHSAVVCDDCEVDLQEQRCGGCGDLISNPPAGLEVSKLMAHVHMCLGDDTTDTCYRCTHTYITPPTPSFPSVADTECQTTTSGASIPFQQLPSKRRHRIVAEGCCWRWRRGGQQLQR